MILFFRAEARFRSHILLSGQKRSGRLSDSGKRVFIFTYYVNVRTLACRFRPSDFGLVRDALSE